MVNKKIKPMYDIGSQYSINNKLWRLAEVTNKGTYVFQYEDVSGAYQTMRFNESEMNNIVKTNHIYSEVDNEH